MRAFQAHLLLTAFAVLSTGAASAATIGTWTASSTITNATTSSPTLGNNTNGNASAIMYASFPTITLSNVGDAITFSGSVTISGGVASTDQGIRFGIFDNNGSSNATNWRGYLGTNRANGTSSIWERNNQTSGDFLGTSSAVTLLTSPGITVGSLPASGAFSFSETITKTLTGVSISFSLSGPGGYSWGASASDTTPNGGVSLEYDRVGIGFSGGYSADQAVFSNITVVPEPSAAVFGGMGLLALLRRRRA
jgi:hypothetical protein